MFILAASLLVVITLAILTAPWWWPGRTNPKRFLSGDDLAQELIEDVQTGTLAEKDLAPAKQDLQATAIPSPEEPDTTVDPAPRWRIAHAGLLVIPLAALILYGFLGNWRAAIFGQKAAIQYEATESVVALRRQVARHPKSLVDWEKLGQQDEALGHYARAAADFKHAVGVDQQPDATLLALWGEAQLLANPRRATPQEKQIFRQVLRLDPKNLRGLWYGGLIALTSGDKAQAAVDWRRLLQQPGLDPADAKLVRAHLQMLKKSPAVGTAAPQLHARRAVVSVQVMVRLNNRFASQVHPGETLYVFVRGAQGGMPLAVRRLSITQFPVNIKLSDADAMLDGHTLSSANGPVEVVAMVAPQGDATLEPGDLVGTQKLTLRRQGQNSVKVLINHKAKSIRD